MLKLKTSRDHKNRHRDYAGVPRSSVIEKLPGRISLGIGGGAAKVEGDVVFPECGAGFGSRVYFVFLFRAPFWSVFKPGDSVGELAVTWLAYSTIAYWFLALIRWFEAESARAVLLAGACYGWMTEGMLVGTQQCVDPE